MSSWLNKSGPKQRRFVNLSEINNKHNNTNIKNIEIIEPYNNISVEILNENKINTEQTIHFITYGNSVCEKALHRIRNEIINTSWFDTIAVCRPKNLSLEFRTKFKDILSQSPGGGFMIWKPEIVKENLNRIKDNDILLYLDAGFTINKLGTDRFYEYIEILNNSEFGIMTYQTPHPEKHWTTKEIFNYFETDAPQYSDTGQYASGFIMIRKNPHSVKIIEEWSKVAYINPYLFTNKYNENQNEYFKDNRHDQSLLSMICKIYGSDVIDTDEGYILPWGEGESLKYPFWATRKRFD